MTPPVEAKGNDKNSANRVILNECEGSKTHRKEILHYTKLRSE